MQHTSIEWVKNPDGTQGYTWNPITGCNNQIDGMCKGGGFPCYAYRLANTRLREWYLANKNVIPGKDGINGLCYDLRYATPFYPRFWDKRIDEPLLHTKRRGIFTCDMSDLFGIGIPEEWTRKVLEVIRTNYEVNQYHDGDGSDRFYLLTKQPQNLIKWSPFPDNCWVGVTATDHHSFAVAMNYLWDVKATIKYISFEPLLGQIPPTPLLFSPSNANIGWLIIGAQTKPYKPPKIEHVREIVEAAGKAGIPVFLKPNLMPIFGDGCVDYWHKHVAYVRGGQLRQEMPAHSYQKGASEMNR